MACVACCFTESISLPAYYWLISRCGTQKLGQVINGDTATNIFTFLFQIKTNLVIQFDDLNLMQVSMNPCQRNQNKVG